jgi:antitoxin ParD1/3/4
MNVTVSITPELNAFIKDKVESGRYTSASEVMREALRLLEQADQKREAELSRLQTAYDEGKASGLAGEFDMARVRNIARKRLA